MHHSHSDLEHKHLCLHPMALGLSLGIMWGISILIVGLLAHFLNYGRTFVVSMGTLYIGYEPSILGSIIGGIIGFIDAFIGGLIIAGLYNLFAHKTCCGTKNIHTDPKEITMNGSDNQ